VAARPSSEPVIDVHAHHFAADLPDFVASTGDARWPSLVVDVDRTRGRIMLGDQQFRAVSPPLWDRDARLAAMDAAGVTVQLVSPVPIMLTYWAEPRLGHEFARAVNDSIAEEVRAAEGRLRGLGTVPLQDPALAIAELRRLTSELGLDGVEIGTHAAGLELDDPAFAEFWAEAEACGAAVFIHPLDGGGDAIRRRGVPYDFGLGMLTDTAMAVQNLLLLVEARRLGALYFGIFRNVELLFADLGVPPGMLSVGAVAIGHRADIDRPSGSPTTRPRRDPTEVIHHNRW